MSTPAPVRISAESRDMTTLAHQLARVGPLADAGARAIVRTAARETYNNARRLVPVRTGRLRSSIYVREDSDGLGFEAGASAPYAAFVEFGTVRMSPRPYLGPAYDQAEMVSNFAINQLLSRLL